MVKNQAKIFSFLNNLYRDDSLETVKRNRDQYGIPLKILSYQDLYGWTMDKIVETVGRKNNCTFCGVFRRQALDRGAMQLGVNKIVTGKVFLKVKLSLVISTTFEIPAKT